LACNFGFLDTWSSPGYREVSLSNKVYPPSIRVLFECVRVVMAFIISVDAFEMKGWDTTKLLRLKTISTFTNAFHHFIVYLASHESHPQPPLGSPSTRHKGFATLQPASQVGAEYRHCKLLNPNSLTPKPNHKRKREDNNSRKDNLLRSLFNAHSSPALWQADAG